MKMFTKTKSLLATTALSATLLFSTSCGNGTSSQNIQIPGISKTSVQLIQDTVLISMVFSDIQLDGGLRYDIPKYANSYVEIGPDAQSNGTLVAFNISITDVLNKKLQALDPTSLPGGRPLPGIVGGRLPAVAFSIEKFPGVVVYLGPQFFGIFLPTKDLGIGSNIITARYYTGNKRIGNMSIVGVDSTNKNSGVLLLLDMNANIQNQLQNYNAQFN